MVKAESGGEERLRVNSDWSIEASSAPKQRERERATA